MKRCFFSLFVCCAMLLHMPARSANALGYGQGTAVDAQNCPLGAAEFQAQYEGLGAYALSDDSDRILLTFDQGYENGYTAAILDTLQEHHVTALFFVTGDYAKRNPELIRRMIREGHAIGNHGMRHASAPTLSQDALKAEIMDLHDFVLQEYDYEMQYFRPPCGEYSEEVLQTVQALGYQTVFWSFAYVDWDPDRQPDPQSALHTLTDAAHGGAVYLLHSVSATNAEILGSLIEALQAKGYQL